jgi:hypothetical protein
MTVEAQKRVHRDKSYIVSELLEMALLDEKSSAVPH